MVFGHDKITYMFKKVLRVFDRFEDVVRGGLSRKPFLYAFVGGTATVLFWRGVWMTADMFPSLNGPVSILVSVIIMLATGLFVSVFVGDAIIFSGLKKEKKLIEKTESEVESEMERLKKIQSEMVDIKRLLEKKGKDFI